MLHTNGIWCWFLGSSKSLTHGAFHLGLPQVATAAEKESQDTKATVDKVQAHVHHDPSNLNLGLGSELAGIFCCAPKMKGLKTCQRCKIQMKVHQFGVARAEVKKRSFPAMSACLHFLSCQIHIPSSHSQVAFCFNLRAVAQQYMNYIAKFQSAKMILDAAATNAKTLTVPAGTLCKTTPDLAASRWVLGWENSHPGENPDESRYEMQLHWFLLRCFSPNDPNIS